MTNAVFVGIDVSKAKIDVFGRGTKLEGTWPRDAKGLARLAKALGKLPVELVVVEASGGYEQAVLVALHRADVPTTLIQPGRARYFAKATGLRAKTDAIDARMLAQMGAALDETLRRWEPRTASNQALRAHIQRRRGLIDMREAERKRLQTATDPAVMASIEMVLACLSKEIKSMECTAESAVKADPVLNERSMLLQGVKGVGALSAISLLVEMPELGTLNRKQVAALAGVAPINRESGTSVGHRFIQGGRHAVRQILYMAGLSASQHNEHLAPIYKRLVQKGKPKKVAIVAVMRKLLIHLNSLIRQSIKEAADRPTQAAS